MNYLGIDVGGSSIKHAVMDVRFIYVGMDDEGKGTLAAGFICVE